MSAIPDRPVGTRLLRPTGKEIFVAHHPPPPRSRSSVTARVLLAVGTVASLAEPASAAYVRAVRDLNVLPRGCDDDKIDVAGTLYFQGRRYHGSAAYAEPRDGYELWSSAGTDSTTKLVRNISRQSGSGPAGFAVLDRATLPPLLFFSADDGLHGRELWVR